jgi:hypothetical protein
MSSLNKRVLGEVSEGKPLNVVSFAVQKAVGINCIQTFADSNCTIYG